MKQMPHYAKQSTVLSAFLLLPFFLLVGMNAIHPLATSWRRAAYVGVVILPLVALLIGLITLGGLLVTKKLTLSFRSIDQLTSSWMLLAVPLLALLIVGFVFGHDSVHCVTSGSPRQVLECVANSK